MKKNDWAEKVGADALCDEIVSYLSCGNYEETARRLLILGNRAQDDPAIHWVLVNFFECYQALAAINRSEDEMKKGKAALLAKLGPDRSLGYLFLEEERFSEEERAIIKKWKTMK